ncbi:MAG TPA: hypothetical protein DCX53_04695 [Anaerolineae bacterium]|nr:hypothetical protein [Anaerolineae bacterium]
MQGLDRYAYVNNSPINYIDPSGHGADCGIGTGCVRDYSKAKTVKDFQDLSWNERKRWLTEFANNPELEDNPHWFDDMIGAIDFMASDANLGKEGGTAEVMDAGVLQALNNGWRLFHGKEQIGGGGDKWAMFFHALIKEFSTDINELIALRLQAEQGGVDYAWDLETTQAAQDGMNVYDQIAFLTFKAGADGYRSLATGFRNSDPLLIDQMQHGNLYSNFGPSIITMTDPRTSGPGLVNIGVFTFDIFYPGKYPGLP